MSLNFLTGVEHQDISRWNGTRGSQSIYKYPVEVECSPLIMFKKKKKSPKPVFYIFSKKGMQF